MHVSIAIFAFVIITGSGLAGWEATEVVPKETGVKGDRYVLIYHPDTDRGTKSIGKAIDNLSQAGHVYALQTLAIHGLIQDETFQKEVFEQLEKIAPELLAAATRSAGNMHNPKMTALRADFARAVMGTPTVTAFATALAAHGMKISRPSFEKLELHKKDQGHVFSCALWLSTEPINLDINVETKKQR
jgi:hypothetical protein